jgi:hypothetical protein
MTKRETILAAGKQIDAIARGRAPDADVPDRAAQDQPASGNSSETGEPSSPESKAGTKADERNAAGNKV